MSYLERVVITVGASDRNLSQEWCCKPHPAPGGVPGSIFPLRSGAPCCAYIYVYITYAGYFPLEYDA